MKVVVGSKNAAKIRAAEIALKRIFSEVEVEGVEVVSGVDGQPKSDQDGITGAINRARAALQKTGADYAIGMEGAISKVNGRWFESGWVAVINKEGKVGLGSSARFEISKKVAQELLNGRELRHTIIDMTGDQEIYQKEGAMGMITNGHLPRDLAYSHGVIFAFSRFISKYKLVEDK
ncbi:MAG TPA: inosine/xanthosine triphosphatase [Candidatus Nanoarchaeia archaeon]|nr:non-canonical purine NTP phosphatase [uncultured archaeon]